MGNANSSSGPGGGGGGGGVAGAATRAAGSARAFAAASGRFGSGRSLTRPGSPGEMANTSATAGLEGHADNLAVPMSEGMLAQGHRHAHHDEDDRDDEESPSAIRARAASYPADASEGLQIVPNDGTGASASTLSTRVSSPQGGAHWHVIVKARTRLHNSQRVARKILYYNGRPGSSFSVGRSQSCDLRLDDDRCAVLNALIQPIDGEGLSGIRVHPKARMYELVGPSRRTSSEATIEIGSVIKVGSVSLEVTDMCTSESDDFVERFAAEIGSSSSGRGSMRGALQEHGKEASSASSSKHEAESDGSVEGGASNEDPDADGEGDARRNTLVNHGADSADDDDDDDAAHESQAHDAEDQELHDNEATADEDEDEAMCYICWGGPDSTLTEDEEVPASSTTADSSQNEGQEVMHLTRELERQGRRPDGLRANPLIQNPCGKCSGSSRYVHLNCLLTWIKSSGSGHCSICNGPLPQHFSSPPPNLELKVVRHRRGQSWVGTRRFRLSFADRSEASIGRDADADVRLGDRSVGSIHARLRFDAETREFKLSDCNSLGGTYLQVRTPIDLAPDVPVNLKIGRTQLTLRMTEKRTTRYPMLPNPLVAWKR